jgi:hydrogenase large subunit
MVTKTIVFSPFSRLEGDLQIQVDIEDGRIVRSRASGTLYRGFEPMLRGRDPLDAIVFTCRVCGQCGLTHSAASAAAIRALIGAEMPPNASIACNVMLAIEAVLSHLTHFYLSFAPDLAEPPQDGAATQRLLPPSGRSYSRALRAREDLLGVLGLFAGKWPNTLAIQPGGTTRPVDASEVRRAHGLVGEYVEFIEQQVIGCELARWLALWSAADLDRWLGEGAHAASDLGIFVTRALQLGLDRMGTWPARYLSSGGWRGPTGETLMRPGFHDGGEAEFDPARIVEHVKHSWYDPYEGGVHPFDGESEPAPERADAYSWAKAPRYAGQPAEAGPLARLVNDRDPLIADLLARCGPSVFVRELARLHETVRLLRQIGLWLDEVDPEEPFCRETRHAESGSGVGLVEAPRGVLGHWIRVEGGKIRNYQIITPTGWNLSPRDSEDCPGPLEAALVGTPVPDPDRPVTVSHVVKSFDPCLFCTVH